MEHFQKILWEMGSIEEYCEKNSLIHKIPAIIKIICVIAYIFVIVSCKPKDVIQIAICALLLMVVILFSGIPFRMFKSRICVVLPVGIVFAIGSLDYRMGIMIIIKAVLCTSCVLTLIGTTSMYAIIRALLMLKVPYIFVYQLEFSYRYITLLLDEALVMYQSYCLRSNQEKGIRLKDMGPFIGQLLLRSFYHAECIQEAYILRGGLAKK